MTDIEKLDWLKLYQKYRKQSDRLSEKLERVSNRSTGVSSYNYRPEGGTNRKSDTTGNSAAVITDLTDELAKSMIQEADQLEKLSEVIASIPDPLTRLCFEFTFIYEGRPGFSLWQLYKIKKKESDQMITEWLPKIEVT